MSLLEKYGKKKFDLASQVMAGVICRCHGDGLGDIISDMTALECKDESLADQSQKDDADINVIVARALAGQQLPDVRAPQYGDFSEIGDYRSAVTAVREMEERFMTLPAKVRARFENDPQALLEFCSDEANRDEAIALGLAFVPKPVPEVIQKVQIVGDKPAT